MKQNKIEALLGLCMRAGRLKSGEFAVEKAVKDGSAQLVVVASDASANTKKLFHDKCAFYQVPCMELGTKESLGHALGKEYRASVAVTDQGFAEAILKQSAQREDGAAAPE